MKNIFGHEHFVNIYYPNIIYINGEIQNSIQRAYNFNQSINYVVLIWNNYLTYCGGMFYGSSDIIEFDFSEFNTSKVEYMGFMFCNCSSLISLNISNFDTSNVMSFRYMFSGCILLTSLNLSNFNTTKLNLMYNMFDGCVNLKYINMKNFNDINLSEYNNIFNKVPENVVLCVNISNVRNKIFNQIKNLKCHNIECSDDWFLYQKKIINTTHFECECELNNCLSCSNLDLDINKKICTNCPNNFYLLDNDTLNYNYYKNCYTNLKGYYLTNSLFYKKCFYTCETCESGGNYFFHNCIKCNENYTHEILLSNNYKNCYDNESNHLSEYPFYNYSIDQMYDIAKREIIESFSNDGNDVLINTTGNHIFQITSLKNELDIIKGGRNNTNKLSVIDLKECGDKLKEIYNLSSDTDLVVLKYENYASNDNDKNIQYEVYDPISFNKLNLSYCSSISIDIYIPAEINQATKELYNDLKEKGYNLFDKNDKFYRDICTPYKSENGTDVTLSDRFNDIYKANELGCQENCYYSDFSMESQYLKCECSVVEQNQINLDMNEKFKVKTIVNSLTNVLKYSNYKVLKCSELVFKKDAFYQNYGSILNFLYILGFFISLIILSTTGMNYLLTEIQNIMQKEKYKDNKKIKKEILNDKNKSKNKNEIKISVYKKNKSKRKTNYIKNNKENFPPKKRKILRKHEKNKSDSKINNSRKLISDIKNIKNKNKNKNIFNNEINSNSGQMINIINNNIKNENQNENQKKSLKPIMIMN